MCTRRDGENGEGAQLGWLFHPLFYSVRERGMITRPSKVTTLALPVGFQFLTILWNHFFSRGMTRATNFYWVLATGHVVRCYIRFISLKFPTNISSWYYRQFTDMKLRLKEVKTKMDVTQLENPRAWIQSRVTWFQSPHTTSNEDTKAGFAISFCL